MLLKSEIMKSGILPLLILCIGLFSCDGTKKISTAQSSVDPVMHFDPAMIDLGMVKKGEVRKMVFPFTNTSKENLQIDFADAGCHCTEIEAPETTIFKPGEKGEVLLTYFSDREEELGAHEKSPLILLKRIDPITGSNMIREITFKLTLEE